MRSFLSQNTLFEVYESFFLFIQFVINIEQVRQKVITLANARNISKTKLGEILGGTKQKGGAGKISQAKPENKNRVYISRANNFLTGKKKGISLQEMNALASFFQKPVRWFLSDEEENDEYMQESLESIRKEMERLQFEKEVINTHIQELQEAYKKHQKE